MMSIQISAPLHKTLDQIAHELAVISGSRRVLVSAWGDSTGDYPTKFAHFDGEVFICRCTDEMYGYAHVVAARNRETIVPVVDVANA